MANERLTSDRVRVAVIGMGGFAGEHHKAIHVLEQEGKCRLICTCDPLPLNFAEQQESWQFSERRVKVYDDYLTMLQAHSTDLDLVTIPTPVPLHAEMHKTAVQMGLPVYLEKPPTLDYAELNQMLIVEQSAKKATNVGFNFIIEDARKDIKRRLLNGEFGKLLQVGFTGIWPRSRSYYQRASWAGRLMLNGKLVLDSPLGNALAHYAHNVLFWAGLSNLYSWADLRSVNAELYRAHPIQGTDTIFLQAQTKQNVELIMALTHACTGDSKHREWLTCEKAIITYTTYQSYEIRWLDGRVEVGSLGNTTAADNIAAHLAYIRGDADQQRPTTRLADCRSFVVLNDLAYISSGTIDTVSTPYIASGNEMGIVAINDIESIISRFVNSGEFPSEQGIPWAHAGKIVTESSLEELDSIVNTMVRAVPIS